MTTINMTAHPAIASLDELESTLDEIRDHIEDTIGADDYLYDYCEAPDILEWVIDDGRFDDIVPFMSAILYEIRLRTYHVN